MFTQRNILAGLVFAASAISGEPAMDSKDLAAILEASVISSARPSISRTTSWRSWAGGANATCIAQYTVS